MLDRTYDDRRTAAVRDLGFGLALLAAPVWLGGQDAPSVYQGALFKRATLVVADIDRSLRIYRDVLGFHLDGVSESGPDSYSYPVFRIPSSAKVRFATLSAGKVQARTLALIEVKGVSLDRPRAPLTAASVIRTHDLKRDIESLRGLGLEITAPKLAKGAEFDFEEAAFVDPDGHLVVLYEILGPEPAGRERTLAVATAAFERFRRGLASGDWQGWYDMLAEDVTFHFPAGRWQGQHRGKAKAIEFFRYVSSVFPEGLQLELDRVTADETTVTFEFRDWGRLVLPGQAPRDYENRVAISLDVRGDEIAGYREYFGIVGPGPAPTHLR
jgi:catechol 2,3-dioxygenase-like lactoylglutathione lyase family enzyme